MIFCCFKKNQITVIFLRDKVIRQNEKKKARFRRLAWVFKNDNGNVRCSQKFFLQVSMLFSGT